MGIAGLIDFFDTISTHDLVSHKCLQYGRHTGTLRSLKTGFGMGARMGEVRDQSSAGPLGPNVLTSLGSVPISICLLYQMLYVIASMSYFSLNYAHESASHPNPAANHLRQLNDQNRFRLNKISTLLSTLV